MNENTGMGVDAAPDHGLSENHEARQGLADVTESAHTPMMQQRIPLLLLTF